MTKKIDTDQFRFELLTRLGDSALIMGHRLSEWSGDAPTLEEDMALSNIALDDWTGPVVVDRRGTGRGCWAY